VLHLHTQANVALAVASDFEFFDFFDFMKTEQAPPPRGDRGVFFFFFFSLRAGPGLSVPRKKRSRGQPVSGSTGP